MVMTEVLDGFAVLCTDGIHSTFALYSRLTRAIQDLYDCNKEHQTKKCIQPTAAMHNVKERACAAMTYSEFHKMMTDAKKLTVRDVWGLMLTRIPGMIGITCLKMRIWESSISVSHA